MTKELLKRVHLELLDVLNSINQDVVHHDGDYFHELLRDVELALAQPEQEPESECNPQDLCAGCRCEYAAQPEQKRPQNCGTGYCSCIECVMEPPQRTWVGLTDEETDDAARYCVKSGQSVNAAIRGIEAKLKEKNT
jgi:hypothetical protein